MAGDADNMQLKPQAPSASARTRAARQKGVVLLFAIIVLVAMSLAAIGLMRSVLTGNRVAANLAFQQSAMQSADAGAERAIAWLEQKSRQLEKNDPPTLANKLFNDITASGTTDYNYVATAGETPDPSTQSWDSYWKSLENAHQTNPLPEDSAGNKVSFAIHRLCAMAGDATKSGCQASPMLNSSVQTSSKSNSLKLTLPSQVYYRITVRVEGPRNAVAYSQAIVAI